ncbi:MAG: hypothetical protein IGS49_06720, partial [Chlorogloeopsis fritschii C42_A2020_084]|uniref:hypothetical protein n=1 Tax=Chlorogloeopsis fritschii TaxID=1124 RepID=UPI0019F71DCE
FGSCPVSCREYLQTQLLAPFYLFPWESDSSERWWRRFKNDLPLFAVPHNEVRDSLGMSGSNFWVFHQESVLFGEST